jgi:hypothetical protein
MSNANTPNRHSGGEKTAWLLLLGFLAILGLMKYKSGRPSNSAEPAPISSKAPLVPTQVPAVATPIARLNVAWWDGTGELQQLVARLPPQEALALGLSVVLTATDTYAARVRITNTGNVPVRIFPENIVVHFGDDAVGVTTVNHANFLQRGVLQPGRFAEGLVMFRARVDIGALIRLGSGALSYEDDTVQVVYSRGD